MKYLIFGNKGQLGKEFTNIFQQNSIQHSGYDIDEIDIADRDAVNALIDKEKPNIIINCAAYNLVDKGEKDFHTAFKANALGPKNLAEASKNRGIFLVHYSTDYVFDGQKKDGQYSENDAPNPLSVYGKSKLSGELFVQEVNPDHLIFRVSWVYGEGSQNFIHKFLGWAKANDTLNIVDDEISTPCSTTTIAQTTLLALERDITGLYHLTNSGFCSRYQWTQLINDHLNLGKIIKATSIDNFELPAERPKYSPMSNKKLSEELGISIESWQSALKKFLDKFAI